MPPPDAARSDTHIRASIYVPAGTRCLDTRSPTLTGGRFDGQAASLWLPPGKGQTPQHSPSAAALRLELNTGTPAESSGIGQPQLTSGSSYSYSGLSSSL